MPQSGPICTGQHWHKATMRANLKCINNKGGVAMNDKIDMLYVTMIECAICLKEIPESEAKIFEAQDYLQHFCGIDCYKKWQDQQKHQNASDEDL